MQYKYHVHIIQGIPSYEGLDIILMLKNTLAIRNGYDEG